MFVHNLNPVALSAGPITIHWYGIFYVTGFIITYFWMRHVARKKYIKHFTQELLDSFMIYLVLGIVLGARVLQFVFFRPLELFSNPLELFMVWHGGMSFHGGLIGAILAMILFSRKYKIKLLALADHIVLPASLALGLGRFANFINGEMVGVETSVPWCVQFTRVDDLCRHPTQIYEGLKTWAVFGVLYFVRNKPRKDGALLWLFMILYGTFRFLLNFLRDNMSETVISFLGISMGQLLSLLMVVVGAFMLFRKD